MKASGNQVVMPLNIAVMIDPNDPVFKMAEVLGEIDFETLFVDGTKIEANANRYTFVWAKAVEKRLKKLS